MVTCIKSPGICAPLFIVLQKNVNAPNKGEIIALQAQYMLFVCYLIP